MTDREKELLCQIADLKAECANMRHVELLRRKHYLVGSNQADWEAYVVLRDEVFGPVNVDSREVTPLKQI